MVAPPHPYGVRPAGTFHLSGRHPAQPPRSQHSVDSPAVNQPAWRGSSLGSLSVLPDELIARILTMLDVRALCRTHAVSRALYLLGHQPGLWRSRVLADFGGHHPFRSSWKETYARAAEPDRALPHVPLTASRGERPRPCRACYVKKETLRACKRLASCLGNHTWIAYSTHVPVPHQPTARIFRITYTIPGSLGRLRSSVTGLLLRRWTGGQG